ncbi:hypothetical protein FXO38_33242 [Capsicum annuum]|nr:hypothetical protein FXO38_33242 [Capsicum annuum]
MKQSPGFVHPDYPLHVCKLTKAIYGLKQAHQAWFHRFSTFLLAHGFICSKSDSSMFIRKCSSGTLILLLYVDDIILTGSHASLVDNFIRCLSSQFAMKDLSDLHYFLGVHATRTSDGLHLSQQKYVSDLLVKFHMHTCNPIRTPFASQTLISLMDGELISDPTEYQSMVGALQYLTLTRPDIAYAVNVVSQFMYAPRTTHLHSVKHIFRYLQGTINHGIFLKASSPVAIMVAYSDADWACCPDSRRSTTGFVVFLGDNLISWRANKQPTVSRSSTKADGDCLHCC